MALSVRYRGSRRESAVAQLFSLGCTGDAPVTIFMSDIFTRSTRSPHFLQRAHFLLVTRVPNPHLGHIAPLAISRPMTRFIPSLCARGRAAQQVAGANRHCRFLLFALDFISSDATHCRWLSFFR